MISYQMYFCSSHDKIPCRNTCMTTSLHSEGGLGPDKTTLIPQASVSSLESERSCICMLGVSTFPSVSAISILDFELFWRCVCVCVFFFLKYFNIYSSPLSLKCIYQKWLNNVSKTKSKNYWLKFQKVEQIHYAFIKLIDIIICDVDASVTRTQTHITDVICFQYFYREQTEYYFTH